MQAGILHTVWLLSAGVIASSIVNGKDSAMGILYGNSFAAFLVITLILAGGAAWLTGRAVAQSWGSLLIAVVYMVPLTAAARFLHYALADGDLISLHYALINFVILVGIVSLAYRVANTGLMAKQYPWLYRRTSPVTLEKVSGSGT